MDDGDARGARRDLNIAQNHAIRRRWSEGRAHACGTKARGAAARGMVPRGPEDVAGKSGRVEDQHQVKQDRRCIEKKADLHSGKCVHHVVKSFSRNSASAVCLGKSWLLVA